MFAGNYQCPHPERITTWEDDEKKWSEIRSENIVCYLLDTKACDLREVKAYKSLDAYNYALSGWVKQLLIHKTDGDLVLLKACVQGSQSTKKLKNAWVCAEKDGEVVTAGCTCMDGEARVCSHVGAVLFKVDLAATLGYTRHACMDEAAKWNRGTKENVVPAALSNIDFTMERGASTSTRKHAPQAKKVSCLP